MENLESFKNLSEILELLQCNLETDIDKLNDKKVFYLESDGEIISNKCLSLYALDTFCKVNKKDLLNGFSEDNFETKKVSINRFDDEWSR
jgi:hypothetical protein